MSFASRSPLNITSHLQSMPLASQTQRKALSGSTSSTAHELALWSTDSSCSFNGQVLSISGSSLGFDGSDLFRNAHIALERGSIYGLVSPNGGGKTSFVRALSELPGFPSPAQFSISYLTTDLDHHPPVDASAKDYCLARVQDRIASIALEIDRLEQELEAITQDDDDDDHNKRIESISDRLADYYDIQEELAVQAETNADRMMEELQFGTLLPQQPFVTLSSGWQYKCGLVSSLLTRPDCLIVDEPSFLDDPSTEWFVEQILHMVSSSVHTKPALVILISHKEALMEHVCDRILYLNPSSKTLTLYSCKFREFQQAHADNLSHAKRASTLAGQAQQDAKQSLDNLRKQLQKREGNLAKITRQHADKRFIKGKNKEAKQNADHAAASKLKRLQKQAVAMEQQHELMKESRIPPLHLESADLQRMDRPIVELVDVAFGYDGSSTLLLQDVNLHIMGTDKVIVNAANGAGKSTIINIIMGKLHATSGEVRRDHIGVIAYFPQDALFELVARYGNGSAIEFLQGKDCHLSEVEARSYLGRFGLKGNLALRKIKTLSAGQRVRLWLAREFLVKDEKPSLLVLDEVSENLDKETTDSLLESIRSFGGAVLAISHDEYFIENFPSTQMWRIQNGQIRSFLCHEH